jgi:hypothetical protein
METRPRDERVRPAAMTRLHVLTSPAARDHKRLSAIAAIDSQYSMAGTPSWKAAGRRWLVAAKARRAKRWGIDVEAEDGHTDGVGGFEVTGAGDSQFGVFNTGAM